MSPLPVEFYNRSVLEVARDLLGARLMRRLDGQWTGGYITETEAYQGEADLACHARAGRTPRTEVMYGQPGKAYVYFVYGMHWMFNAVAEPEGMPAAVLIRAVQPVEGRAEIARRRPVARERDWTNGPGRICKALAIDGSCNGMDLCSTESTLIIAKGQTVPEASILTGPRVGIPNVPEPWRSKDWRYRIDLQSWNPHSTQNGV